jgi:hypothetical protein
MLPARVLTPLVEETERRPPSNRLRRSLLRGRPQNLQMEQRV